MTPKQRLLEQAARIADERAVRCRRAAELAAERYPDEPHLATSERCAQSEAEHIARQIRALMAGRVIL